MMLYRSVLGNKLGAMAIGSNRLAVLPHRVSMVCPDLIQGFENRRNERFGPSFLMAGSPLFVTDLSKQFDFSEIQFVLSEQVCI